MWARKVFRLPYLWPSRLKVIFMIGCLMAVFTSFFQYMQSANVMYLNLDKPEHHTIECLVPSKCKNAEDIDACLAELDAEGFFTDFSTGPSYNQCPVTPPTVENRTCANPWLPLSVYKGNSGRLHTKNGGFNFFKSWSMCFILIMVVQSILMLVHDLALLDKTKRGQIYCLADATAEIPNVRNYLMCFGCRKRRYGHHTENGGKSDASQSAPLLDDGPHVPDFYLQNRRRLRKCLWPLWIILQTTLFMVVIYPSSLILFVIYPIRMSRIMVMLTAVLQSVWSLVFVIWTAASFGFQEYEVRWTAETVSGDPSTPNCLCRCLFPLNQQTIFRMLLFGVCLLCHGINICLRGLKGLRRSEWAVLFGVTFAMPIEAWPVRWTRPQEAGGDNIRWRENNDGNVQDEPAFDPFALMDEQPESAESRVVLRPTPREGREQEHRARLDDGIGHLGFPGPFPSDFREKPVALRCMAMIRACIAGCLVHPSQDGANRSRVNLGMRTSSTHSMASVASNSSESP